MTIFWNASMQTDANGEALVSFISPIPYEELEIKVSTVSRTGEIASVKTKF